MVNSSRRPVPRRAVLVGTGAAVLAGCRVPAPGSPTGSARPTASVVATSSTNPFGVVAHSTVDVATDGADYPGDWTDALVTAAARSASALKVQPSATSQLGADLASAFPQGEPPDLVLNGGPDPLPLGQLATQLTDLTGLLDTRQGAQPTLRSRLRPGVVAQATLGGRVVGLPAVWTVHGLWFSAALFQQQGWHAPSTWDELFALGRLARAKGKHLFCWGRETATWFQRLALSSAIKQGGARVGAAIDALDARCWSHAAVQEAFARIHTLVTSDMIRPGGTARPWRDVMTAWSNDQSVLFVPGGSWIGVQAGIHDDFLLDVVPDPLLGPGAAMPASAAHVQASGTWVVPAKAANPRGGLEVLRLAMARAQASAFCTTNQVLSTRTDVTPTTTRSIARQEALVAAAGQHVYGLRSLDAYGTSHDHQALWNAFLSGSMDVATLTRESQRITDLVRADTTIAKLSA